MISRRAALLAVMLVAAAAACRPITSNPPPPTPAGSEPAAVEAAAAGPTVGAVISTLAFDTCHAPSVSQMSVWRSSSPYRAVGVYIGGVNATCPPFFNNPNLDANWVTSVTQQQGWRVLPLWVGRQAWCRGGSGQKITQEGSIQATVEGFEEANQAANAAAYFGIGPATANHIGSPIYFDLENYPTPNAACEESVRSFVNGWVAGLHERGFEAGFYSSGSSGIRNQVGTAIFYPSYEVADDLWFADWNGSATVYGSPWVPDTMWIHRRHHQYLGGTNPDETPRHEIYGGVSINIDSNASDGLAAERPLYRDPNWPLPPKQR